jgi:hypothetical protein
MKPAFRRGIFLVARNSDYIGKYFWRGKIVVKRGMIVNAVHMLRTAGTKRSSVGWNSLAVSATASKKEESFVAVPKATDLTTRKIQTVAARGQAVSPCCAVVRDG